MDDERKARSLQIWQKYVDEGEHFLNASQEFTSSELDQKRMDIIPSIVNLINSYRTNLITLETFKTQLDSINKRNRLWGFMGINGQMFFNMLVKTSASGEKTAEFEIILKKSIGLPPSIEATRQLIDEFSAYTKSLALFVHDSRAAPKTGSVNYFLSFFWQIQDPKKFPLYYTSMIDVSREHDLWIPENSNSNDYINYCHFVDQLLELFSKQVKRNLTYWDVEHAFWFVKQNPEAEKPVKETLEKTVKVIHPKSEEKELPESYIPPIVSILPRLAINDPELENVCKDNKFAIEKVFENRIDILFKMLGYETEALGQGHGRVPDGIAISPEFQYAIGYDAKVRKDPYSIGTDERAFKEYINWIFDHLKRKGIRRIYFFVISGSFSGDHNDVIKSIKMDTDVKEVRLVEVRALIALLEQKLRNPSFSLGPDGILQLFSESGILTEADVTEFAGL